MITPRYLFLLVILHLILRSRPQVGVSKDASAGGALAWFETPA
jgi:hypothetical protein